MVPSLLPGWKWWFPSRRQRAEGRRQKAEGRGQKAEGRRQKAEGRGQKAEGRGQKVEGTFSGKPVGLPVFRNSLRFQPKPGTKHQA